MNTLLFYIALLYIFSLFAVRAFLTSPTEHESEINFGVVVAALEKFFHFFLAGLTGVGACAGVCNGVLCDFGKTLKEYILGNEAVIGRIGVRAVVLDAVRNI